MMENDPVSKLLAAERAVSPPSGLATLGRARLMSSLAAEAASAAGGVTALKLNAAALAKWIGAGFAVGLAGAGVAAYTTAQPPVAPAVVAPAPLVARATAMTSEPVAMVPEAPTAQVVSAPAAAPVRPEPSVPLATPPSAAPTFDEELRLITAAKRELDGGRAHLARAWLQEHGARFPTGVFGIEREGLLVLAACSEQKRPALARKFVARYPGSPMVSQVLRRCNEASEGEPQVDFPETQK